MGHFAEVQLDLLVTSVQMSVEIRTAELRTVWALNAAHRGDAHGPRSDAASGRTAAQPTTPKDR